MADPKDNESFFRKVVRFVANPATDWHELNSRQDGEIRETELEKSELKAMIGLDQHPEEATHRS